jgi:hypothetical protein
MSYEYLTDGPTARELNPEAWDAFWNTDPVTERDYLARSDPREDLMYSDSLNMRRGGTALGSLQY